MEKFWVVLAVNKDDECDLVVDPGMNDCLENNFYDIKAAEAHARQEAADTEQDHAVFQAVSLFSPQKRPVKKTTLK